MVAKINDRNFFRREISVIGSAVVVYKTCACAGNDDTLGQAVGVSDLHRYKCLYLRYVLCGLFL